MWRAVEGGVGQNSGALKMEIMLLLAVEIRLCVDRLTLCPDALWVCGTTCYNTTNNRNMASGFHAYI